MHITFKFHKKDKNGVPLYLPYFNGGLVSNTRLYDPVDCSESSPAYAETEAYLQGLRDMLKLTGNRVTGKKITYSFEGEG